jgi:hypothetical protein
LISVLGGQSLVTQRSARGENIAGRSLFVVAAGLLVASIAGCGETRVDGASQGLHGAVAAEQGSSVAPEAPDNQQSSDAAVATETGGDSKTADSSAPKTADQRARPKSSGSGRIKDLTFDDLKFEMEKEDPFERSLLTPQIEELDGKPIRIRGYILPQSVFSQTGFNRFVLVRDNQECCFGPGAALFDAIVVEMEPGKTADYNIFPVAVEGTFQIKELKGPGGRHLAIYYMLASAVK